MVTKREAVTASWGEVNNQLQRRADLIPNLVETVKGYAKQETTVFGDIANARAGLLNAHGDPKATIQANGQLDGALGRLLALSENYPDLKSNAELSAPFRRTSRHGKPDQRGQNALQPAIFRTTTRLSGSFPTAFGRVWADSSGTTTISRRARALRTCPRSASRRVGAHRRHKRDVGHPSSAIRQMRCGCPLLRWAPAVSSGI